MSNLSLKNRLKSVFLGVIFAVLGIFGLISSPLLSTSVSAIPVSDESTESSQTTNSNNSQPANANTSDTEATPNESTTNTDSNTSTDDTNTESTEDEEKTTCYDQIGAIGWLVCPTTGALGKAIDSIYSQIEKILVLSPISTNSTSPIYQVWQVMRDFTNIVFIILLLVVVYSQVTGLGISNYGVKKALPKLIIAAILVNLSYLICAAAVDLSNILGSGLRGIFTSIQETAINTGGLGDASNLSYTELTAALLSGGTVAGVAIALTGIWPTLAALACAIISVIIGLATIGLRQAVVSILIMISPLAFVCYLLPNTEQWFKKWKSIFSSMIVFYPMFSVLYGASALAGWALIANAITTGSVFMLIVGMLVQVLPLLLSISLMKMSGTVLGAVSSRLDNLANKPREGIRAAAAQRHELRRLRHINYSHMPSASLQRYLDKRNRARELDIDHEASIRKDVAEIWAQKGLADRARKYDPAYNNDYREGRRKLGKTTKSIQAAKRAMNLSLDADTARKNAAHTLSNYEDFHRDSKVDAKLQNLGAKSFKENYTAALAEENDAYADQDYIMNEFNKYRAQYNEDAPEDSPENYNYKHYISGAAGALGREGEVYVMGQVIARSAANEAKRKAYVNQVLSKYGFNKRDFRNMIIGYHNNDDGLAVDPKTGELLKFTDKHGKVRTEKFQGEMLYYYPDQLARAAYNKYELDKDGNKLYYYDATDQDGNFVSRVYRRDGPTMKEHFQNWDMTITDPINGLYAMLSGIKEGEYAQYGLDGVGIANLSTTVGRAELSSGFKEKAAYAGPMYANSVTERLIKNPIHQHLNILDNLIKTAKPSSFNLQDYFALNTLALLMDPDNWEDMLFDRNALLSYLNVNKEQLKVFNDSGQIIAPEAATDQQLQEAVIKKFINPAVPKFLNLMSRITPNIIDNQKPSSQASWLKLFDNVLKLTENEDVRALLENDSEEDREKLRQLHERYPIFAEPVDPNAGDTISKARALSHALKDRRAKSKNSENGQSDQPIRQSNTGPSPALRQRMQRSQRRANGGMSQIDQPFQLTEEDLQADKDFEKYEMDQWAKNPENNLDNLNQLDLLKAEALDNRIEYINSVRDFLDDAIVEDHRFQQVIDEFEFFLIENPEIDIDAIDSRIRELIILYTYDY